jgi:hypothetical protein
MVSDLLFYQLGLLGLLWLCIMLHIKPRHDLRDLPRFW